MIHGVHRRGPQEQTADLRPVGSPVVLRLRLIFSPIALLLHTRQLPTRRRQQCGRPRSTNSVLALRQPRLLGHEDAES